MTSTATTLRTADLLDVDALAERLEEEVGLDETDAFVVAGLRLTGRPTGCALLAVARAGRCAAVQVLAAHRVLREVV